MEEPKTTKTQGKCAHVFKLGHYFLCVLGFLVEIKTEGVLLCHARKKCENRKLLHLNRRLELEAFYET